jgi:thioredoxin reductase (NADPH)
VISEAELSETIMRAYILRRVAYMSDRTGGVVVFGARDSQETLILRHFLNRNATPAAYFDSDADEEAQALMQRFGVQPQDIPAVVTISGEVLRGPRCASWPTASASVRRASTAACSTWW